MPNYKTPLSAEESAFAAENHNLIYGFLLLKCLPVDEFYDTVAFGFLRAVRTYFARPELHKYAFSTIAYRAMSLDLKHAREFQMRAMRSGETVAYNDEINATGMQKPVAEQVAQMIRLERYIEKLTPLQRRIAILRSNGYKNYEIAKVCGTHRNRITTELTDAKQRIKKAMLEEKALAA